MTLYAAGFWIAFLVAAVFYAQRARHPAQRPVAAYLIFVTVFTVAAFVLFGAATAVLQAAGRSTVLGHPVAAALFLIVVFGPAFFLARWQVRKPPRPPRRP